MYSRDISHQVIVPAPPRPIEGATGTRRATIQGRAGLGEEVSVVHMAGVVLERCDQRRD